jgi:Raf kinase inhibitor-like YbhB/YbcL family protein
MSLQFTEAPFDAAGPIPAEHTCDGADVSPPLAWAGVPDGAERLALVIDDPDAPGPGAFTHWVLFNLPPGTTALPRHYAAGAASRHDGDDGAREGTNDFGDVGYGGPCPPRGETHRYVFTLYALDVAPALDAGVGPDALRDAMRGHVCAEAELVGTYRRG